MEIQSPGLFVEPITLESLLTRTSVHASRNPLFVRLLKRILAATQASGFINSDYQEINKVDSDTAYREIHEMVEREFVVHKGWGRGAKYYVILPEKIDVELFTERFPVLRRLLSTQKTMSNTEYRKIFGLSRYQAFP